MKNSVLIKASNSLIDDYSPECVVLSCLVSCVLSLQKPSIDDLMTVLSSSLPLRCLKFLGSRHPTLVLPLVPELLSTHPYFDTPEPDMDDPACILHTPEDFKTHLC